MSDYSQPYKVVICGGGLAGLTLALQLKIQDESIDVTVLEKTKRPLPVAAHKVGESTVEIGAHYWSNVLGLKSYLEKHQFPKLGLRYFYGDTSKPFETRPELGPSMFSPVPTYQVDRGTFETDLRQMVEDAGVHLIEGVSLNSINISPSQLNEVVFEVDGSGKSIEANWVVDAMGRRRYLQTKLGLKEQSPHKASSVWFRVEGKISVDDLVEKSKTSWQNRNVEDRYYSTNHLMGLGYWVWLIPLASGNTSIGIVTQNDLHDFPTYSRSFETSLEWLNQNEPCLAKLLKDKEILDFRKIKDYSYSSKKLFSEDGFSCVGEAGIFSDPFYSPGSDMIAVTNTFTVNLILADANQKLTSEKVNQLNDFILKTMFPDQLSYYVKGYHTFGNTQIAASKFLWDTLYYWRVYAHAFMNGVFEDFDRLKQFELFVQKTSTINKTLQASFFEWSKSIPSQNHFDYIDLARKEVFIQSAISLLTKPDETIIDKHYDTQLQFFQNLKREIENHISENQKIQTGFSGFFGRLNAMAKQKNTYNKFISSIGNGAFLYAVRDFYVNLMVRGKERVHFGWILKMLYAK